MRFVRGFDIVSIQACLVEGGTKNRQKQTCAAQKPCPLYPRKAAVQLGMSAWANSGTAACIPPRGLNVRYGPIVDSQCATFRYNGRMGASSNMPPAVSRPEKGSAIRRLTSAAPGIETLLHYQFAKDFRHDLVAGISVAAVALPVAVAYAQLAGFNPVVGLYSSIL